MRAACIKALIEEARINPHLWLLTADLGFSFLEPFQKEFPDRFINVGVAEQNMLSIAAGLALAGKKVFVYSIINFLVFRALAQIRQDICYHQLDVHLIGVGAGLSYKTAGYSHYGIEDIGALRGFAPLKIYCPADEYQTTFVMQKIFEDKGPSYLRLGKSSSDTASAKSLFSCLQTYQLGKDATFFCLGEILWPLLALTKGLDVAVISVIKAHPLDEEAICEIARRTPKVIVVEEHQKTGLTEALAEILLRRGCFVKFSCVCLNTELKSIEEMLYDPSFDLHSYL